MQQEGLQPVLKALLLQEQAFKIRTHSHRAGLAAASPAKVSSARGHQPLKFTRCCWLLPWDEDAPGMLRKGKCRGAGLERMLQVLGRDVRGWASRWEPAGCC